MAEPVLNFTITPHAANEMRRRGIEEELVRRVLLAPEQREAVRAGRDVLQSRVEIQGHVYLLRIFVDVDRSPREVVTAYRTSKIDKYWSKMP